MLEFFTQYLEYAEVRFSVKTFKEKKLVFQLLLKSIPPQTQVAQVTRATILQHLQEQAKQRSGYAANKDRKNLIAAWNWGTKYIDHFPAGNPCFVDRFPEQRQRRYVPPEKDYWVVLDQTESPQDRVMLLTFLHLAARRNEVFRLRWDDIDFQRRQVRLATRKRRDGTLEFDHVPLTVDLLSELVAHHQTACCEWVFPNPANLQPYYERGKWMKRICSKAGVRHFGLHAIRHLTASILVQADVPLVDVQTILRHKKIVTTERYIHRLRSVRGSLSVLEGRSKSLADEPAITEPELSNTEFHKPA